MLSTNSLSAHLEDLIQTLRDSTHHGLLALPSPLHHFQHLEQFRNLTQRHIAKFPSLQVIPSRSGSGSGSGGSWRRAIRLENLEINDRAIDARSAVTIAIFFIVNILVIYPLRIPLPLFFPRTFAKLTASKSAPARANEPVPVKVDDASATRAQEASLNGASKDGVGDVAPQNAEKKETPHATDVKRWYFVLGLETAPVIGVILLLASTCITGEVLRDGIVGGAGVRPYDIMTLFLSFAYIAISLDRTNLLRYLAFHVATRAASSGRKLYVAFFCFFSFTGLLVGNDPLILSGTPFLAHFSRLAGISEPLAYLFTQFQTANLVSALLVSSNPTNLVLSSGFGLSFLSYSAWLALPTVASIVILYPTLRYWVFRKEGMIPLTLTPPTHDPANALHDPWGAAFGGVVFLITIIVLIALSAVGKLEGVEGVWTVTAPAALLILTRDVAYDLVSAKNRQVAVNETSRQAGQEKGAAGVVSDDTGAATKETAGEGITSPPSGAISSTATSSREATPPEDEATPVKPPSQTPPSDPSPIPASSPTLTSRPPSPLPRRPQQSDATQRPFNNLRNRLPTVTYIISHLPWTLIPFAFSMFILVESLAHVGWIRVFGGWWAAWSRVGGTAGAVGMMGLIGALGCNIFGTNIGCVVLLSRVMQQWAVLEPNVSEQTFFGAVFALAIGSNFGAYSFVFPASLAGLLWRHLLAQKDITITRKQFAQWNAIPVVVTTIVGCLVVAGEVCVMLPNQNQS